MKVLFATDGSKYSEEAGWLLARLPHRDPMQLTVLTTVAAPITAFYSPAKTFLDKMMDEDRRLAKQHQTSIRDMFAGADVTLDCQIVEGRAGETIVDVARQREVELIVIGAKGHSQIDRILLGSTSDYVATHAHCSVLVVRETGMPDSDRPLRVALAYDASSPAQSALEELLDFDWKEHTEFSVLAVAGYSPVFNPDFGFNTDTLVHQAHEAVDLARGQLEKRVATVHTHVIDNDYVGEGLVRFTENQHVDCMVIGDTGRSTIARALLGSVSRYVLRHCVCSVWITRHQNAVQQRRSSGEQTVRA